MHWLPLPISLASRVGTIHICSHAFQISDIGLYTRKVSDVPLVIVQVTQKIL